MRTAFEEYLFQHPPYIKHEETLVVHNSEIEAAEREFFLLIKTNDGLRQIPRPLLVSILEVFASQDWPDRLEMTFKRSEQTGWLYIHKWQKVFPSA